VAPPKVFSWPRQWDEETCVKLPSREHIRHMFGDLKFFDTITACKFQMALMQWFITGEARLTRGASVNFRGGVSPYVLKYLNNA